jgi:copper(I)-binding protein
MNPVHTDRSFRRERGTSSKRSIPEMTRSTTIKFLVSAVLLVAVALGIAGRGVVAEDEATPAASPMASPGAGMGMGGTGAAYMTIANAGAAADRLIAGQTSVAEVVEIHEIVPEGDVMQMRPIEGGLEVPAGGSVTLEPGGYHVMLIGLSEDLVAGMTFDLTLTFEQAGDVVVQVVVQRSVPEGDEVQTFQVGELTITGPWSRPAPALRDAMGTPAASPTA